MKIGHPADPTVLASSSAGIAAATEATTAAIPSALPAVADPSIKVELSNAASLMSAGSVPEFDAAKVSRIAQAIADGSFKVNPDVIADRLLANAQELLSKGLR
ncbi:MAG: flagellar biosynthesis anti-sigma factor FlgM [Burkholderiaceae bacterium]